MNKYDEAVKIINENQKIIKDFENQINEGDRDKTGLHWLFVEYVPGYQQWYDLKFSTGLHHGYCGSSSCTKDGSEKAGQVLNEALNQLKSEIINKCIDILQKEIKEAKTQAKEEAQKVLENIEDET